MTVVDGGKFMLKFFENLFVTPACDHIYKLAQTTFIDAGMRKTCIYRCELCGKERVYVI